MVVYSDLDTIKLKLRVPDDTIDSELEIYMDEIDDYINREIRKKLGTTDWNGDDIIIPLTETTSPQITKDMIAMSNDLVEAKFRSKTTNDETLWDRAKDEFSEFLTEKFGWSSGNGFRKIPTITFTPTSGAQGSTVTVGGSDWKVRAEVKIYFNDTLISTSPALIVTNGTGSFSGVTFVISTSVADGSTKLRVTDGKSAVTKTFTVT